MLKGKTRISPDNRLIFWCVGCDEPHAVPIDRWHWNGDRERPTLIPSILIRSGHYAPGANCPPCCWCTYNREHPEDKAPFVCSVCHSFVTDGRIQFLAECTHSYAGKTVDLEDWEA
jgi:hypothetical protein